MTSLVHLTLVDSDASDRDERRPLCGASILTDYISQRGGPAHALNHVTLDAFFGNTGMIPSEEPDHPEVVNGTFEFDDGNWFLPEWTPLFGFGDAKELVRVAAASEVKLGGTFLEAIEVHEVFLREKQYLERRRNEAARARSDEVQRRGEEE
ncbi:hypothetical protein JCM8097_004061 [Rhodosporidiobolus ruineniae]